MIDGKYISEALAQWWTTLESGWQAVLLGLFALIVVYLGVPIPW
ncbi:hypothetical protein [Halomarina pelagica]|nr:hypothetical protein [Halomarina sp. BND7]